MMDRRFPNLCRVDHAPSVRGGDVAVLRRVAEAVAKRTESKVCIRTSQNGRTAHLHVYPVDPAHGYALPQNLTVIVENGQFNPRLESGVDQMVRLIQYARRPALLQDREMAAAKAAAEHDERQRDGEWFEGRTHKMEETLRRHKNRRGMSKKFRPSAVVDGLKKRGAAA